MYFLRTSNIKVTKQWCKQIYMRTQNMWMEQQFKNMSIALFLNLFWWMLSTMKY